MGNYLKNLEGRVRDKPPAPRKTRKYTTPPIKNNEYYAEKRGFESYSEYKRYLQLRGFYKKQLLDLPSSLNLDIGFDLREIERLRRKGDSLVVKLAEVDTELADGFIEKTFRDGMERYLKLINATANFQVYYEHNTIVIKPYDIESMAFLDASRLILKRELLR